MLLFRTFRNTDPPAVAAIWRSWAGKHGLLQPVSIDLLEQFVFGKPYFDYRGMFLAFDDGRPAGFAQAAFGPNEQRSGISTKIGLVPLILVRPEYQPTDLAGELVARCERYLCERGAEVVYGGARRPIDPFFLGLSGGREFPGVLESDAAMMDLYVGRGYQIVERASIFRLTLGSSRLGVDRRQVQFRRRMLVQVIVDPPARDWWEACTLGDFTLTRFELVPRGGGSPLAYALVRAIEWQSEFAQGPAAGLLDLAVDAGWRRQGLASFLLTEACRTLAAQGAASVETQVLQSNDPFMALCRRLGFEEAGRVVVFRKDVKPG